MKFILEFAKFRDMYTIKGVDMSINNFKNDTQLIVDIPIEKYNNTIFLKWYNTSTHSIPEKIKNRTTFSSTSEFNNFIKKTFNDLIDNHFKEIDQSGRYALYFKENNFYLILDIDYDNLFKKYVLIFVVTITNSTPDEKIYKIIEINDEYF
jgi:hypothetical protein